jgi:hypothetical protein
MGIAFGGGHDVSEDAFGGALVDLHGATITATYDTLGP